MVYKILTPVLLAIGLATTALRFLVPSAFGFAIASF
jgi:hypothetical protein